MDKNWEDSEAFDPVECARASHTVRADRISVSAARVESPSLSEPRRNVTATIVRARAEIVFGVQRSTIGTTNSERYRVSYPCPAILRDGNKHRTKRLERLGGLTPCRSPEVTARRSVHRPPGR